MSRWGKPKKNKKKFDPRYFMNERMGDINEIYRDVPPELPKPDKSPERDWLDEVPVLLRIISHDRIRQLVMKKYVEEIKRYESEVETYRKEVERSSSRNKDMYEKKLKSARQCLKKFTEDFPPDIFRYLDRWDVFGPMEAHKIEKIKRIFDSWNEVYGKNPGYDAVEINYRIENAGKKDKTPSGQLYDMERDPTEIIPGQRFPARKE